MHQEGALARTHSRPRRTLRAAAAVAGFAMIVTLVASFVPAAGASSLGDALRYFHQHQTKAGGFTATGSPQADMTPWVIMSIRAAGQSPSSSTWRKGKRTPIQYLQALDLRKVATAGTSASSSAPAFYAKVIMAYRAAGKQSLISRAGSRRVNLVAALLAYQNAGGRFTTSPGGAGSYAAVTTTSYACLALKAAGSGSGSMKKGCRWLQTQATSSGGFSWNPGSTPDVDTTAAAVQALIRCGGTSRNAPVITKALRFIKERQQANGGFSHAAGTSTSVESTALAVQAIVAAGQNPASSAWRKGGKTPIAYIAGRQARDGYFYHMGTISSVPLLTTSQAVMALRRRPMPVL